MCEITQHHFKSDCFFGLKIKTESVLVFPRGVESQSESAFKTSHLTLSLQHNAVNLQTLQSAFSLLCFPVSISFECLDLHYR